MPLSLPLYSYVKVRFVRRVRRFLRSKSSRKRFRTSSDPSDVSSPGVRQRDESFIREYDRASVLQRTVKSLHFGDGEEKERAAKEIERLIKESVKIRKLMVDLGVVPALVAMADSDQLAVRALIELANGSFVHRTLMVEEGILSKLPKNAKFAAMDSTSHEFAELLCSLSSLANTRVFIASTEPAILYLLTILNSESNPNTNPSPKTKTFCLAALFNISTVLENAETLISNGVIPTLLRFSSLKEHSEKALPTLANLAVSSRGKQALESNSTFPEILIEVMTWEEKPKCQELSAYIIMILAHQSWALRERLAKSRIVPALLELALLGTPLAQKRALKLLQWFKDERQARVGPHSGPQTGRVAAGSAFNKKEIEKGKRMMRSLVKQSLDKNMEIITRRANGGECSSPTIRRTLVSSNSSKSLPF
ncbi:U-box domain-containing protein 7-like [Cucurbita pepo subsp. pepo]|uniref:U-box domain-containing protein 7-like n=1 Tax=Cucurbita pepo subsp. pepo TaxID=3664 RepID=UPI000C9D3601|nr:U-box domain-containing protein 7-like [Cucurbita pepo subsp. pepo]